MSFSKSLYSCSLFIILGFLGMTLGAQNSVLQSANEIEQPAFKMQNPESIAESIAESKVGTYNASPVNAKTQKIEAIANEIAMLKAGSDTNKYGENAIEQTLKNYALPESNLANLSTSEMNTVEDFVNGFKASDTMELRLLKAYTRLVSASK